MAYILTIGREGSFAHGPLKISLQTLQPLQSAENRGSVSYKRGVFSYNQLFFLQRILWLT